MTWYLDLNITHTQKTDFFKGGEGILELQVTGFRSCDRPQRTAGGACGPERRGQRGTAGRGVDGTDVGGASPLREFSPCAKDPRATEASQKCRPEPRGTFSRAPCQPLAGAVTKHRVRRLRGSCKTGKGGPVGPLPGRATAPARAVQCSPNTECPQQGHTCLATEIPVP